jgi:hypothetical protein
MNKLIVISHDTRKGGVGEYNGDVFLCKEGAVEFLKEQGFTNLGERGWDSNYCEYSDEEDHIELLEKTVEKWSKEANE